MASARNIYSPVTSLRFLFSLIAGALASVFSVEDSADSNSVVKNEDLDEAEVLLALLACS